MLKRLIFGMALIAAVVAVSTTAEAQPRWDFDPPKIETVRPVNREARTVNDMVKAADLPEISMKQPFSEETDYMSLPGYARYLLYDRSGHWLTREQAVATWGNGAEAASR